MIQRFADWLIYEVAGLGADSIPLFIGFVKGGIPLGVTLAFLITSPLVNEVAVAMFLGTFGWQVTLIYVVSGILLGMAGGIILGRMHLEPLLSDWVRQIQAQSSAQSAEWEAEHISFLQRLPSILRDAWKIVSGVLLYVIIGIAIGAAMHGYVPEGFFETWLSKDNWFAVPLAVICVRQCCRHSASHRGVCGQGHSPRHRHSLHDVGGGTVVTRSHHAEEGDDVATGRNILRHHHLIYYLIRIPV